MYFADFCNDFVLEFQLSNALIFALSLPQFDLLDLLPSVTQGAARRRAWGSLPARRARAPNIPSAVRTGKRRRRHQRPRQRQGLHAFMPSRTGNHTGVLPGYKLISYSTFALVLIGTRLSSLPMLANERGRRLHNRHEQPMTCWFFEPGYLRVLTSTDTKVL